MVSPDLASRGDSSLSERKRGLFIALSFVLLARPFPKSSLSIVCRNPFKRDYRDIFSERHVVQRLKILVLTMDYAYGGIQ
jgi:hypothetical protein